MPYLDHKDLLLAVLDGEFVDKPPVILPSGLVSRPIDSVLDSEGLRLDELHSDSKKLSKLSLAVQSATQVESLAMPFVLTVESEAYGGESEESVASTKPTIFRYPFKKVYEICTLEKLDPLTSDRLPVVIDTLKELKGKSEELNLPLIGDLVAPLSLASTLVDAGAILKAMAKKDSVVNDSLDLLAQGSEAFASEMIRAGVDCFCIVDPISTVNILGAKFFELYTVPYLNRLTEFCHSLEKPVIVHLCGSLEKLPIDMLSADCISLDSENSLEFISSIADDFVVMAGPDDKALSGCSVELQEGARELVSNGVRILSSSCALTGGVNPTNLKALVESSYLIAEEAE